MAPGSEAYEILLLTIGYALGLKDVDSEQWSESAMAMHDMDNGNVAGLRPADVEAIQYTYGTQQAEDAFHTRWSWDTGLGAIRHDGNDTAQTITGTGMRDLIVGYGGDDVLRGGSGNDVIYGGSGVNTISGGSGADVMAVDAFRSQATLSGFRLGYEAGSSARNTASGTLSAPGEEHNFNGIEVIAFGDGRLVFDENDPVAQITRLYQTALGRLPDSVGRENWTNLLLNGTPLSKLAEGFLGSDEFQARFGQPDDSIFVIRAYQQGLGRAPDVAGLEAWQAQIAAGLGRAELLTGFSESAESRSLTYPLLSRGLWDADDQAAEIARLYVAVLGRAPDASGLRNWKEQAVHGTDMTEIANEFARSAEFSMRYPGAGDAEFVAAVYQNALGRGVDPAGQAFWLNHLAQGMTRGEMVAGVSHSTEFLILSNGVTEGGITFA
ncbi:DUF4214 domain-containing protein [Teichococcus vastitatis]|uniref:DUF4214 domain-containing protein n=2 Tax=Teichococcus vastitatis TaxID=2307076 RepID=A0ABS9WAV4_9PROT|nr:DUF4214 domain-containing protein [Pseudoroseomonas vastitatis]MCI0756128.1 DUF4214 domain-containing protein [Pseudoroseomonas vastitatis]